MKRLIYILPLMLALIISSCNKLHPVKRLTLSEKEEAINMRQNEFAIRLLQKACESGEDNVFISPFCVSAVCSLWANEADSSALAQVMSALGVQDFTLEDMNAYYKLMFGKLPYIDTRSDVVLANALWVDDDAHIDDEFSKVAEEYYNTETNVIDLNNPESAKMINKWASKKTHGLISQIVTPGQIDEGARTILTSALYFNGIWKFPFYSSSTTEETFTLSDGTTTTVSMMNKEEEEVAVTPTYEYDFIDDSLYLVADTAHPRYFDARMLSLPFKGAIDRFEDCYTLDIVLPREGLSCEEYLRLMTIEDLQNLNNYIEYEEVAVGVPKFTIENRHEFNNDLKALGMPDGLLSFSDLQQSTYFDINETGAKAAAVTKIYYFSAGYIEYVYTPFIVDRPFLLFIRECKYGTILFAGKIGNPTFTK